MTTVTLIVETHEGEDLVIKKVQHEIGKMKLIQFTKTLAHIKDIVKALNEESAVAEMFEEFFNGGEQKFDIENMSEADVETVMKEADGEFLIKGVNAFMQLVERLPDQAIQLLSTLSGIDKHTLENQEIETVLDIVDAVIQVNDVELLIARIKKSFGLTANKLKFLNFKKEVTA